MRAHGYNATTVDDVCREAGVTKGGFFHYFKSKDDIAKAAVTYFHERKVKDYEEAPFRKLPDPLDRVFGRLDYVKGAIACSTQVTKGCLMGVFAQELAFTHPDIREILQSYFTMIARDFAADLAAAKAAVAPTADFDPKQVASLYLAVVQGSLMLAKIAGSNEIIHQNIEQFRHYLQFSFGLVPPPTQVLTRSNTETC